MQMSLTVHRGLVLQVAVLQTGHGELGDRVRVKQFLAATLQVILAEDVAYPLSVSSTSPFWLFTEIATALSADSLEVGPHPVRIGRCHGDSCHLDRGCKRLQ